MILFYDTCSLINFQADIFNSEEIFYVSNLTINELENIKSSGYKDEKTKYDARTLLKRLEENEDKYKIILYKTEYSNRIVEFGLPETTDSKIIASAYCFFQDNDIDGIFCTKDLACKEIAKAIGLNTNYTIEQEEEYTGFIEKDFDIIELGLFYADILQNNINKYNLLENQYLIIKDNGKIIDKYKWKNNEYHQIQFQKIESKMFGKIVPKNGDHYQQLAMDSLANNQITMLRGAAGSGKSMLGLAYLFQELEKGKIDKIIMFVNPVATRDSCKFGFLPGSALEKILGSQIGHFLTSKIGDLGMVEKLVSDGELLLIPMADCRGFDTSGMRAGIYCTESQNMTIDMMKLMIQRIGEDSICVIEGDDQTQVDMSIYAGANNGLKRLSEVFRGQDFYGEITLQHCYRSKIAERAALM